MALQESPGTSQPEEKAVSPDSGAVRPPTPGKLFSQSADSSLTSGDGKGRQGRGASTWLPGKDKNHKSDPATSTSLVCPGGNQPAKSSNRDAAEDLVAAGEEGSRKEEEAMEPKKEVSGPTRSRSDASEVSHSALQVVAGCSPLLLSALCIFLCIDHC